MDAVKIFNTDPLLLTTCEYLCATFSRCVIMPPKKNERGKKNRKAKANGSATSQQQTTVVSKRCPPTRRAKAKAGKAVKKTVTNTLTNSSKPLVSVGKRKSRKADPIFFTADSGIQYRIGGICLYSGCTEIYVWE